jgi:hypothetical protein
MKLRTCNKPVIAFYHTKEGLFSLIRYNQRIRFMMYC